MGDRNYYPNQYSSFTAQNYGGYSQSQQSPYSQPQQSLSSLFDMKPNQAHSKMPAYNTGSSCSKGQLSDTNYTTQAMRHAQSRETSYSRGDFQQNDSERPPPSYEESRNDILLSRSRKDHNYKKTLIPPKKCSPAWNYIVDLGGREPLPQKRSFSDFFDIPGKKPEGESQRVMEQYSNFSQQHSTSFSSDNRYQSDNSFSHRSDTPAEQVSDLKQFNDNRGFGEQNHKRESGKGEFREHGNRQDSDSQVRGRGKRNEHTDIGKQQAWNRDEFEDNKNTNYSWPDSNVDRIRSVSKDYGNDRSEEGRHEEFNNRYQSDNSFSHRSDTPARQVSDLKQFNDNRGFGEQTHKRESGKGEFREHGNWQDSDSQVRERRKCNEHTDIGKQQAWNRDEFEDNKNTNYPWPDLNVDRIRSVSKDYGNDRSEEGRNEELNIQEEGSGDERDEEDANSDGEWEKVNVFHPDHNLQNKYRYYPPTAEEMGEMFRNLIIYFFFKVPKNMRERNPFVVICESFRKSSGYANLEVEDGYEFQNKDRKFCTLRYKGMMMVRGVGDNGNIKEARVWAAVDLINKLAMSCYTLKAKQEYFSVDSFKKQLRSGNVPGIYRFVPPIIALDFETSRAYLMDMFSKQDTDEEQMFSLPDKEGIKLKSWASKNGFDVRVIIKDKWIGICQHRTLQYWRDKILASGSMETAKFVLIPPQGIGNLLMPKYNIKEAVPTLKLHFPKLQKLTVLYGPHGVGPTINKGLVPWERRGGGFRNRNTNKKQKKIMRQLKEGVPLTETKGFKFLSKRKKKQLKNKLGVS